jgi:hypothetical protein
MSSPLPASPFYLYDPPMERLGDEGDQSSFTMAAQSSAALKCTTCLPNAVPAPPCVRGRAAQALRPAAVNRRLSYGAPLLAAALER